jgi:hypothetical protein
MGVIDSTNGGRQEKLGRGLSNTRNNSLSIEEGSEYSLGYSRQLAATFNQVYIDQGMVNSTTAM